MIHARDDGDGSSKLAAAAVRHLGHDLVAYRASETTLSRLVAVIEDLAQEVEASPTRDRPIADEVRRRSRPPDQDGPVVHGELCPVSGQENPLGLAMTAYRDGDTIYGRVVLGAASAGATGRAHGGVIAALLDDVMGFVLDSIERTAGYTAALNVTFRHPVPVNTELTVSGALRHKEGRKVFISATLLKDGSVLAEADAIFVAADLV